MPLSQFNKGISVSWLANVKDKSKEGHEAYVQMLKTSQALKDLKAIVRKELLYLDNQEIDREDFSDPNWAYKQAFRNGQRKQVIKLMELLGFIDDQT